MPETHNNGGCTVMIEDDGAILVRPGDSLSKYSMAIHGKYTKFNEYSRKQGQTHIPIADVNRIYHGETLYHEPTRRLRTSLVDEPVQRPVVTKETLERIFRSEFGNSQIWDPSSMAINVMRMGISANSLSGLVPTAAELLGVGSVQTSVVGAGVAGGLVAAGVVGALASIYMSYQALSYVGNFGNRAASTRGFNYGMVAWAYDDGILPFPSGWDKIVRNGPHVQHVQVYRDNWAQGFADGRAACEREYKARKIPKYDLQNYLIALSGPNQWMGRECLAARLLLDFANRQLNGTFNYSAEVKQYLTSPYSWYPNDDPPILGNSSRPPYPEKLNAIYPR